MRLCRAHPDPMALLDRMVGAAADPRWQLTKLGSGGQALLYQVRVPENHSLREAGALLVLKVYRSSAAAQEGIAREEFEALSRLRSTIHGQVINGWRIVSPAPVECSARPAALLMTAVPGRPLRSLLAREGMLPAKVVASVAQATLGVLKQYWLTQEQIYGDLNLSNVLCDPAGRTLAFVDPGMPHPMCRCEGVGRRCYPASRDLAYLLYGIAASVKSSLGCPGRRRREREVAEMMIGNLLGALTPDGRETLLREIAGCAQVHLESHLRGSWSVAGLWRVVLRKLASRSVRESLERLRCIPEGVCTVTPTLEGGVKP